MIRVNGELIKPLPGLPPVLPISPKSGIPPVIVTPPKIPTVDTPPPLPFDLPPDFDLNKLEGAKPSVPTSKIITPPTGILIPRKIDISSATEQDLMDILKSGDKIGLNPRFSSNAKELGKLKNPDRARLMSLYGDVAGNDLKLNKTLDQLLRKKYGFSDNTSIEDMYKVLGKEMGVEELPVLTQSWDENSYGTYSPRITKSGNINISEIAKSDGVAANTITHELRHFNELGKGFEYDRELMKKGQAPTGARKIYDATKSGSTSENKVGDRLLMMQHIAEENNKKHWPGLQDLYRETSNKFPNYTDALDVVDYLEKPHFKNSFLAENLRRLGKGLSPIANAIGPWIGPAGTALTAGAILAAPNPAEAAILEGMSNVIPGGVSELGVSDEQKDLDRQFFKRIRQSSQRQGK